MDFNLQQQPDQLILPLQISKIIYDEWNADLMIMDRPDQIYGKALHGLNGSIKFKNGNLYKGELQNGMLYGKGEFIWVNGVQYRGDFQFNVIEGVGKYQWPDSSVYQGQVKNGLRHGKGTFTAPGGDAVYIGEWSEGLREGKGKITFKSGSVYEGEFCQGYKQGFGQMIYPSGNYYEGEWKLDKQEGHGTMRWLTTNEKYYGAWENNQQNGFGVHIWLETQGEGQLLRNRYQGQWQDGQRHGYGVFYYANGSKYQGEWKGNLKDGNAIFTEDNGNTTQGIFQTDRLIKPFEGALEMQQMFDQSRQQHERNQEEARKAEEQQASGDPSKKKSAKEEAQQQEIAAQKQKQAQEKKERERRQEIEANPFSYLCDFSDLTNGINGDILKIHTNLQTMLLRHNSNLKAWYKAYSNQRENILGEDAFSMDLSNFWKLMKETRALNAEVTLAAVNRLFYQGPKNKFTIKTNESDLSKYIEIAQQLNRKLDHNELKDIYLLEMIMKASESGVASKIDYQSKDFETTYLGEAVTKITEYDLHDGGQIILYRHFVELIVRVSLLKYSEINELHRGVEKLIEKQLQPFFESLINSNNGNQSTHSGKDNEQKFDHKTETLIQLYHKQLEKLFQMVQTVNQSAQMGIIDKTAKFKDIISILSKADIVRESHQKNAVILFFEKHFDSQSTLSYIDVIIKEKQKEREKERKDTKNKNSQDKDAQKVKKVVVDYDKMKADRMIQILDTELIFPQFCELLIGFVLKREKELYNIQDQEDFQQQSRPLFEPIFQVDILQGQQKQESRFWPRSEKDDLKDHLSEIRKQKEEEDKEQKRKEEERKREQREKALMALEDVNIPSDQQENNEDDEDY